MKTLRKRVVTYVKKTQGAAHISSHASGKLRLVGGFPLDSLAKKWIPFITYAVLPRKKVDSLHYTCRIPSRKSGFFHTNGNECLPPYLMNVSLIQQEQQAYLGFPVK